MIGINLAEILKLILVGFFVMLFFGSEYYLVRDILRFPQIFKAPVAENKIEWAFYLVVVAFIITLLTIIFYGIGMVFSWAVNKSFTGLSLLAGAFSISLLIIARILGISGYPVFIRIINFIVSGGITSWFILDRMKNMHLINITTLILTPEDIISILIAGIVTMIMIEILLWLNIKKGLLKNLRLTLPTIPLANVFSRTKDVENYVGRSQLITKVVQMIEKTPNDPIEVKWLTGTLDEKIQDAFINFIKRCSDNKIYLKLLCKREFFDKNGNISNEKLKEEILQFQNEEKIKIDAKPLEPGFLRMIVLIDKKESKRVIVGVTTGDKKEARSGFDAPPPLNYFFNGLFDYLYSIAG